MPAATDMCHHHMRVHQFSRKQNLSPIQNPKRGGVVTKESITQIREICVLHDQNIVWMHVGLELGSICRFCGLHFPYILFCWSMPFCVFICSGIDRNTQSPVKYILNLVAST